MAAKFVRSAESIKFSSGTVHPPTSAGGNLGLGAATREADQARKMRFPE